MCAQAPVSLCSTLNLVYLCRRAQARKRKAEKLKDAGSPIRLPSKPIAMQVSGDAVWTAESGHVLRKSSLEVCVSPRQSEMSVSFSDPKTGATLQLYKGHEGPVSALALVDNYVITGSWDKVSVSKQSKVCCVCVWVRLPESRVARVSGGRYSFAPSPCPSRPLTPAYSQTDYSCLGCQRTSLMIITGYYHSHINRQKHSSAPPSPTETLSRPCWLYRHSVCLHQDPPTKRSASGP